MFVRNSEGTVAASQHAVQLFDTPESLSTTVSTFLHDGLVAGNPVLAVITAEHWSPVEKRLGELGHDVSGATANGDLTRLDAVAVLNRLTRNRYPDAKLFEQVVGTLVRRLAARGVPLQIYGEMVDLLAMAAYFTWARRLEELWNELVEQVPSMLLCGYSAVHFGSPRSTDALRSICASHTHVRTNPGDELGSWLVGATGYGPSAHAPAVPASS
jgi:hypothetical protein